MHIGEAIKSSEVTGVDADCAARAGPGHPTTLLSPSHSRESRLWLPSMSDVESKTSKSACPNGAQEDAGEAVRCRVPITHLRSPMLINWLGLVTCFA